jgi:hypothetical protein
MCITGQSSGSAIVRVAIPITCVQPSYLSPSRAGGKVSTMNAHWSLPVIARPKFNSCPTPNMGEKGGRHAKTWEVADRSPIRLLDAPPRKRESHPTGAGPCEPLLNVSWHLCPQFITAGSVTPYSLIIALHHRIDGEGNAYAMKSSNVFHDKGQV